MAATLVALRDLPVLATLAAAGTVYLVVLWKLGFFDSVSRDLLPIPWLRGSSTRVRAAALPRSVAVATGRAAAAAEEEAGSSAG